MFLDGYFYPYLDYHVHKLGFLMYAEKNKTLNEFENNKIISNLKAIVAKQTLGLSGA